MGSKKEVNGRMYNLDNLVRLSTYAEKFKVSVTYIHQLCNTKRGGPMEAVIIDGTKFIDITKYPTLPKKTDTL